MQRLQMQPLWFSWPLAIDQTSFKHPVQAGYDLDLGISAQRTMFSTPKSQFVSAALCAAYTALPTPFTLHFTADIISQISAHLVRILTDFDGLGEESHPSCYKPALYQTLSN